MLIRSQTYRSGDEAIYISDVHQSYQGEIATIIEFDPEHRLLGLKFQDGEIISAFWDEIKLVETENVENLHLTLTVDEVLLMMQATEMLASEGMYEWKMKILDSVQKKLEAVYQKPVMTREQLDLKLEKERKQLRDLKLQDVEHFILASKRNLYEFRYEIK